jgi:hypothetical protein
MRVLDLGEAGYEGQSEAQKHYFQIDGDIDQERGINDTDCDQITKQLVDMGLQAHCQPDESRHNVVQIDTYSGHTTIADALAKAGYEADAVGDPSGFKFHEGEANIVAETPNKFTKADFDANEDKNYHTENGVELAKAFGTPEEIEQMEQIAKNHYARGHILSDEINARNEIVGKYLPSLESQEEAMGKMSEGDLGPGDMELLKPMVDMDPKVLKIYAKNIVKKYPHLKDNVARLLPSNEAVVEQDIEEDFMDDRKYQSLEELQDKLADIKSHIERLGVMDGATEWEGKNPTGTADIHDQLTTMYKSIDGLMGATERALKIVPAEQNPSTQEFKKKYGMDEDVKAEDVMMNKYGLSATNINGKFRSYQHGKLTGEFDSMEELAKHQQGLLDDDNVEEAKTKNCGCGQDPCITYGEKKVNEFDIKKSFNTVANNVKQSLSSVVGQNPLRAKANKNANKNGPSIAKQINWGGKYESEDLNELDTFAPKTDYIKGPGGEYYKIEYRNNSGLTGHRKDDKARFVSINPASDKEVQALSLDDMIAKGDSSIHQGHDHQGGLPWSDEDIAVYAYGDDDYEENIPNNAKMKLIKVMTTEAEKKKKSELGTKIRSWRETKADMKKKIEASKPGDKK